MAEAILSPFLDSIIGNLASEAMQKLQLVWGTDVEMELENLMSTLFAIKAVLEDAEERQFHSKAVKDWLPKLKHIGYDADEIVTEARKSESAETGTEAAPGSKKKKWWAWDWFTSPFNSSKRNMTSRIREINVRLDKIAQERRDFHLETRCASKQIEIIRGQRQRLSSSVRDESSQFLGREDDTEQIVKFLLSDDSSKRNFSMIAIIGMGGVGKTTLARVVYNDNRITENFEIKAWICVSEHFDVERLTKELITSISKSACDLSDMDSLQCCLRDKLNGKKFLLVLDDVWSEDGSDWEQLQAPFSFGAKGSKIVVTTRSRAVSASMQGASTHLLKCLSEKDCWSLFVNQAFYDENADAYTELIKLGEKLVNKCGGLPLAAKALGGLLSSKRQVREWENILKSSIWSLPGTAGNIIPALNLSYQHLPAQLKRCFTFCSVFPKDYKFRKEKLVQQWVAQGFVPAEEGKQIEDTSSEYFNDLLQRSFFQLDYYDESEEAFATYKMHDLIHDLAQFISGDECFHMENGKSCGVPGNTRHLSYFDDHRRLIDFKLFYESRGLRTLLLTNAHINEKVLHGIFERLRFIRVLDLYGCWIRDLPKSIGNLQLLRYLDLSRSGIRELPESICSIYNLQVLLLRGCYQLVMLPNEMRKLINLCHLGIEGCTNIVSMPPQIGRLTCLQTLPFFRVGTERGRGIAELKELTGIRGELIIEKLENVAEAEDAREANLKSKRFIDFLRLMWSEYRSNSLQNSGTLEEEIANGLQPHPNLKILELYNYLGTQFPGWMVEMDMLELLSNLRSLKLINCSRCSILPPLGCLPSLSSLRIRSMGQVKRIGREFYGMAAGGFPSLKVLRLKEMLNLEEWQENEGANFPCLEELKIENCPQLRQMPNLNPLPNLTRLNIIRCARLVSLQMSLPNLTYLDIFNCESLVSLQMPLPNLTHLSIRWCSSFVSLQMPLPNLTRLVIVQCTNFVSLQMPFSHLQRCNIYTCPRLISLPRLPSLKELVLSKMENLEEWGDVEGEACFPHLQNLSIIQCPKMRRWPDVLPVLQQVAVKDSHGLNELPPSVSVLELGGVVSERLWNSVPGLSFLSTLIVDSIPSPTSMPRGMLQALTQLKDLTIRSCKELVTLEHEVLPLHLTGLGLYNCPNLKSLPRALHSLTSLHFLLIRECPSITSLPEQGLPSSLLSLMISGCPAIKARYEKDVGEDWPKISHIPDVHIWD